MNPRPAQRKQLVDITSSAFKAQAYEFYAQKRASEPVCLVRWGRQPTWLVTRYEDVLVVLKDERFVKNPRSVQSANQLAQQGWVPAFVRPLERNILDLDEPDHGRLRVLVHKAFTPARVEQMQSRIQAITDDLLAAMLQKKPSKRAKIDLIADFALPLPLTVITELLGIPVADRDKFHRWSTGMLVAPSTWNMLRVIPAMWSMMRYLRQLFAQRRAQPSDDLLSALVQAEQSGDRLSEDELLAMVVVLLIAGHETTVNLIASGTLALLQQPDQLVLLRNDPSLIRSAVEELVRFVNPLETATERYAREDVTIQGVTIQKGEMVLAGLAAANRDETQFTNPDRLDITRQNNRHLGFGMGSHYCLGAPLARMEAAIAINTLLQRLPDLQLAIPPAQLRWRPTPTVRGLERLPVKIG